MNIVEDHKKLIDKKSELLAKIIKIRSETENKVEALEEDIDSCDKELDALCGEFKGKGIRHITPQEWSLFLQKRAFGGVSSNHNLVMSRCAEALQQTTGMFAPFCLVLVRILAGNSIDQVGLEDKEKEVVRNFIALHPEGFKKEKKDADIQQEGKTKDGSDESTPAKGKPKTTRKRKTKASPKEGANA